MGNGFASNITITWTHVDPDMSQYGITRPHWVNLYFVTHQSKIEMRIWYSKLINSLWPVDTIWPYRSGSTLIQVIAWYLTAYLNQCWPPVVSHDGVSQFGGIHPRAVLEEILKMFMESLKITDLKLQPHLLEANELTINAFIDHGQNGIQN